jgi:DNA-binding NarL/FixJ family response regulator
LRNPSPTSSLKPGPKRSSGSKLRSSKEEEEILELVRTGAGRFILKNATVEDFLRTMRCARQKENLFPSVD